MSDTRFFRTLNSNAIAYEIDKNSITKLNQIAIGSSAKIFSGIFNLDQSLVAIKTMSPIRASGIRNDKRVELCSREIEVMAYITNKNIPNCVLLKGYFLDALTYNIVVTPYAKKGTLTQHLKDLNNQEAGIMYDIANGLHYLHQEKIIHGDLKPDNILIDETDNLKTALIADFGGSKQEDIDPLNENLRYTLLFAAQELLFSQTPSFSKESDMYSFGMVLWCIITKKETPYQNIPKSNDLKLDLKRHLAKGQTEVIPSSCPSRISGLISQCLLFSPKARPKISTALEIIDAHKEMKLNS